jgi:aminopeptidase-like protein
MNSQALYSFASQLFPYCRSITGDGVRRTLADIGQHIRLKRTEVPSGRKAFDWTVPEEWNIEDAWIADADGRRVVDFRTHNLHIVSYSEPVDTTLPLQQLRAKVHTSAVDPGWIPYRTSYYRRDWGFCAAARDVAGWREGKYRVHVASRLAKGALSYGEFLLRGRSRDEVLLFTHVCHPSLANDNLSGIAIATALATWLQESPRRYTYRIVFAPGTIGSLCWLKANEAGLARVKHGLVLGLLGDPAPFTYKRSRRGNAPIDQVAQYALRELGTTNNCIDFEPYGYDERQLCSPGFNLPVGRLTRSVNSGYAQYHSSADDLSLITPDSLSAGLALCRRIVEIIESNRTNRNLLPKGEPQLGRRGLYGPLGGQSPETSTRALLWVLNQSDGHASLLDIAQRAGIAYDLVSAAAASLARAGLLREAAIRRGRKQ